MVSQEGRCVGVGTLVHDLQKIGFPDELRVLCDLRTVY